MRRLALVLAAGQLAATPALAQVPVQVQFPGQPGAPGDVAAIQRSLHDDLQTLGQDIAAAIRAQPVPADPSAKLDAIAAKLDAILAQLKAMPGGAGGSGTVTAGHAAAPAQTADAFFPAKPGDAQFPSPENSRIVRLGASVQGKPYLLDKRGSIHTLGPPTGTKSGYLINGTEIGAYEGAKANQLLVRQGEVYVQLSGGQWQHADPGMGNGLYNTGLPDAAGGGASVGGAAAGGAAAGGAAGGGPAPAPVATMPPPAAVAPGSSGRVLTVGKSCPTLYACVKAARDGDIIDGAGALSLGAAPIIQATIELRNIRIDCSSGELTYGKGCLVNDKDVTYRNVEVFGATKNPVADNGAGCIRPNSASYVTVIGSLVHDCPQGVAGGGFPWVLTMTDTVLDRNGLNDGLTHNLYVSGGAVRVTLTRVTSRNPRGGHAIKSRSASFTCVSCVLSSDETVLDLPDGTATVATVVDSTLTKTPGTGNHRLIGYGEESTKNGTAGVLVTGGTITGGENPFIQGHGVVTFSGTAVVGAKPAGQGVTVQGL